MSLSLEQVNHIAHLARLALTDDEKARYQQQLSAILEHAQRLQELDTEAIPPTASILSLHSVTRPDEIQPSMQRDELLGNAPAAAEGMFRVPVVLE